MRKLRLVLFLLAILLGIAGGLYYGWSVNPQPSSAGALPALRSDFRTDTILMIAETFQADHDPALAVQRLSALGGDSPARLVQQAIITAGELGYSVKDVETLARLSQVLLTYIPAATGGLP
jgi:hypothetical protein